MRVEEFIKVLGVDFFTGVPDSCLKPLCNYLMDRYGISKQHVIAANEGNCTALAAGYHLATGKIPLVYMQNSGIGNVINPVASLMHKEVYGIPCIYVVGWRGEPGVHDEPQHIYQGKVTVSLLEEMGIHTCVVDRDFEVADVQKAMKNFTPVLQAGGNVAFVIRKGALSYDGNIEYQNQYPMQREEIIKHIIRYTEDSPVIATTGKISRELYENRTSEGQGHQFDFLTVGSMGHCSSIALGIAMQHQNARIWCIDGDGSALMHMGAMAVIGSSGQQNLVHIVINNSAHETVGGMPTVADRIQLTEIAKGCGYSHVYRVDDFESLDQILMEAKNAGELFFIEIKSAIGSRENLGRPATAAIDNKKEFMQYLNTKFDYSF